MLTSHELSRIFWISGSVCAGKTTLSEKLAQENDWNVYHADAWFESHRERSTPERHPVFHAVSHITGDALWLRPLEDQILTDEAGALEEFELILEDVKSLLASDPRPIIVDGYIRPKRLLQLHPSKHRAFYLIATKTFLLRQYAQRPWVHEVLAKTSDPETAWNNWMQRDLASACSLEKEVLECEMPWLSVDGSLSFDETARLIGNRFCSPPSPQ